MAGLGFLNNFSAKLTNAISASATSMELDSYNPLNPSAQTLTGGSIHNLKSAIWRGDVFLTITNENNTDYEVVQLTGTNVTFGAIYSLDIVRSAKYSTPKAWPAGSIVEMRLPANVLEEMYSYGGGTGGQALTWDGTLGKPAWANIPEPTFGGGTADQLLTWDVTLDKPVFKTPTSTGVDLTSDQTIDGNKTFSNDININGLSFGRGAGNDWASSASGYQALYSNTTGVHNTASGGFSLYSNTTGNNNTACGLSALYSNTTGGNNTAYGTSALDSNTTGDNNTASGMSALDSNTTGSYNTAYGTSALYSNTTGSTNTACGYIALYSNTTYSNVSGFGYDSYVTGDDQVQLGNGSTTTYVYGTVQNRSDLRDKADVRDTVLGLEFIEALRPVDYRWDMRDSYRLAMPERPPEPPKAPAPLPEDADEAAQSAHAEAVAVHAQAMAEHEITVAAFDVEMARVREANKLENIVRDGSKKRGRYHHGLIAQELKATIDELGVDFGGFQDHSVNGGDDVLSIGYDELVGPLIKAVQQLSARVKALEEQIGGAA